MADHGSDREMNVFGVPGRLTHATTNPNNRNYKPGLWFKQIWKSQTRPIAGYGTGGVMQVKIGFDDDCGNGHNTFSITADVYTIESRRRNDIAAGGCMHEEIAKIFPELAHLLQWHLWSTDGGMHYVANAAFHASNRDCWGTLKGEPRPGSFETFVRFSDVPILHKLNPAFAKFLQEFRKGVHGDFDFEVLTVGYENRPDANYKFGPKYTFGGFGTRWHDCPFDDEGTALRFLTALQRCSPVFEQFPTAWGEGKERDFAAARSVANWPEATDEELSAPDLKEKLEARLPALLAAFRADVQACGFRWEAPQ